MPGLDQQVRVAAFNFLDALRLEHGDMLPFNALVRGFMFQGQRVPLLGPQGIFKPAILDLPLTIATAPPSERKPRPYDDEFSADGLLRYRYRGTDPQHRDNAGLRAALRQRLPRVYLHGIVPGRYMASWPVYIVADDPSALTFRVAVDDRMFVSAPTDATKPEAEIRRGYVTRLVRQRVHPQAFRERVLGAYRQHCAICRLRHQELLEAAHIIADRHPEGEPRATNGLAMCKLHHAAFDAQIIGVTPDYVVEVRADVLLEIDGPMLKHGLQGFHETRLLLPTHAADRPDRVLFANTETNGSDTYRNGPLVARNLPCPDPNCQCIDLRFAVWPIPSSPPIPPPSCAPTGPISTERRS
jgi:putative restriction endonuclease